MVKGFAWYRRVEESWDLSTQISTMAQGSDSGGGAGLQADLKSCTVQGAFATTAVTAVTAQNTHGVQGIFPIPIDFLKKSLG